MLVLCLRMGELIPKTAVGRHVDSGGSKVRAATRDHGKARRNGARCVSSMAVVDFGFAAACMSAIFDRLTRLFEDALHARAVPGGE